MSKPDIQAVLFDLDDTLWAIEPVLHLAESQLYDWLRQRALAVVEHETIISLRARRQLLAGTDPRFLIDLWALRHTALIDVLKEHGADPAMEVFTTGRNTVTPFASMTSFQPCSNSGHV